MSVRSVTIKTIKMIRSEISWHEQFVSTLKFYNLNWLAT